MTGDVDALIVHAPQQEMNFIEDGYASERVPIARNSFVLLGPEPIQTQFTMPFLSFLKKNVASSHVAMIRGPMRRSRPFGDI